MKNILILGATGTFGMALTQRLMQEDENSLLYSPGTQVVSTQIMKIYL